ncbi:MAG: UvrD-helicase domain-containing protein, partial [Deltaproteobacteria bacterium]|nr:UvrD-helicase domain-containing protein [Deltaproteobacteria bacterium]
MISNIRFISAGAGTGKTFRLTEELEKALVERRVRPRGVIGTTFTNKAAAELRERVRERLIQSGYNMLANQMGQALLGTVNSICGILLGRFAFEIGLSPQLQVIPEEDVQLMFNRALDDAISATDVRRLNELSFWMGFKKQWDKKDWRTDLKEIVSAARANNVSPGDLDAWGETSAATLLSHFPDPSNEDLWHRLEDAVNETLDAIPVEKDQKITTQKYISFLHDQKTRITKRRLPWSDWVKLSKETPAQKSREAAEEIQAAAAFYDRHPQLHEDIQNYCRTLFKVAAEALRKYQETKERLGMIDFIDQEQRLLDALKQPEVFEPLKEELELLLVDEFQDTSPIQLALFLKLAEAAREAVFVGDIKQAIYGFRGSDPDLMLAVQREIENQGHQVQILETSYRSRPALVDYTNALFIPAFSDHIPEDQVRLTPSRKEVTGEPAVAHWILCGKNTASHHDALAFGIERLVDSGYRVEDKESGSLRKVRYGDIAVLARTN